MERTLYINLLSLPATAISLIHVLWYLTAEESKLP